MIEMFELPDADVVLKMQCEDCGHVQDVKGIRRDGEVNITLAVHTTGATNVMDYLLLLSR